MANNGCCDCDLNLKCDRKERKVWWESNGKKVRGRDVFTPMPCYINFISDTVDSLPTLSQIKEITDGK